MTNSDFRRSADIVERLRETPLPSLNRIGRDRREAADEIERLRHDLDRHMQIAVDVLNDAQPKQETDWLGEAARWANRAYDMKCALDKAANRFRELGYIDFANDCLAAQPPAAPVDGEKAAKDYEHGYNDGIEWAQTHGRSSAGNGDDLSRRARELADEPVIGAEGRKLLRQMATEIEDLRHDIDRHIQIATDLSNDLPQEAPELRLAASRLTDIITMLDAPDAYNREYIAAVCRSVLSSLTRPHGRTGEP